MMGHDVFFDIDNSVVGWAESDCDYHGLLTKNGFVDKLASQPVEDTAVSTLSPAIPPSTEEPTSSLPQTESQSKDKAIHAAVAECNDLQCRGTVVFLFFVVLVCGICLGRWCSGLSGAVKYHTAPTRVDEVELSPTLNGKFYRDDPTDGTVPDIP